MGKKNKNRFGIIKDHNGKEFFLFEKNTFLALIAISFLTIVLYFFGADAKHFLTSVLQPLPRHLPYDGIVYPVRETPNWVKLTESERKFARGGIPPEKMIEIPPYIPEHLIIPYESLEFGNPAHDQIRNEKITYTVPYLGSYELNGQEKSGSHPAVDIKLPVGTPIYAIGNGVIVKADIRNGGFGNHIVIQHNNFPSPETPSKTETLFSSYSHLNAVLVSERQVVVKGELIGYSGNSGLSTTPHLHFQIDRESAPWHPYWPFSTAEIREAGLTFFQALNSGFGIERAREHTIHPLRYIQSYAGTDRLAPQVASGLPEVAVPEISPYRFVIEVTGDRIIEGGDAAFRIKLQDRDGNILKREVFDDRIKVELRDNRGELNRKFLSSGFFFTGETEAVRAKNLKAGKEKLLLRFQNEEFSSEEFEILTREAAAALPALEIGSSLVAAKPVIADFPESLANEEPPPEILPLGKSYGKEAITRIPFPRIEITLDRKSVTVGETVRGMAQYFDASAKNTAPEDPRTFLSLLRGNAELSAAVISQEEFRNGKFIFTLIPQGEEIIVVQASAGATRGFSEGLPVTVPEPVETSISEPIVSETDSGYEFTDIPPGHELEEALRFLKQQDVIQGYPDGSFQPERPVLRVEALKMIFEALQENVPNAGSLLFPDLQDGAWYLPFVEKAYRETVIKGYPDGTFRPNAEVNVVEFYKMLFLAAKTDINPDIIIELPNGVNEDDWFAPYIQEAVRLNILEVYEDPLRPGRPMTRGDIAKALYKLLAR